MRRFLVLIGAGVISSACASLIGADFDHGTQALDAGASTNEVAPEAGSSMGSDVPAPENPGPDGRCDADFKACENQCVSLRDPAHGCAGGGCAPCSIPHAAAACTAEGTCAVGGCESGRADCNGNATDGCETIIDDDPANCGGCGHSCGSGLVCANGSCAASCPQGLTACGGSCVDLHTTPEHCGTCDVACTDPANGVGTCQNGACAFACNGSYRLCGTSCKADSVTSCGSSCASCTSAPAHGVAACIGGACDFTCQTGYVRIGSSCSKSDKWTTVASMSVGRWKPAAATAKDGRIFVFGGYDSAVTPMATVEAYDPGTNAWSTVASMHTARGGAVAVTADDGRIIVVGGSSGSNYLDTAEAYNPNTNTWAAVASTSTDLPRYFEGATKSVDGRVFVMGGGDSSTMYTHVEAYDPTANTWTVKADMPLAQADMGVATALDGRMVTIGGTKTGTDPLNVVQIYTPSNDTWATGTHMPTARFGLAVVAALDGRVFAVGGSAGSSVYALNEVYTPSTGTWATAASMPTARYQVAATRALDGRIFVIGGSPDVSTLLSTVEAYTP